MPDCRFCFWRILSQTSVFLTQGLTRNYRKKVTLLSKIILDLDSTDDHTHGQQEFSFYHGYYRNHILHPLLIFDADTGDLVCAVLRPGNKGAASHIVPILKRVVEAIRQAVGTDVEIEIRADSGFATLLGSTSSVNVKRINSNMSSG